MLNDIRDMQSYTVTVTHHTECSRVGTGNAVASQ